MRMVINSRVCSDNMFQGFQFGHGEENVEDAIADVAVEEKTEDDDVGGVGILRPGARLPHGATLPPVFHNITD
jgi:hypothetical protein